MGLSVTFPLLWWIINMPFISNPLQKESKILKTKMPEFVI
ncbi:hypothetical protein P7266_0864 [Lactococcus cremoris]|nr:hypothetical protein P7266_0864 [Lactococcus cremoris]